ASTSQSCNSGVHPDRWKVVLTDGAHWVHPKTGVRNIIGLYMDQCSRFLVGKVLVQGKTDLPNADCYVKFFREHWQQYFGKPETLRFEAEGTWRSKALDEAFSQMGIILDPVPGDAHWHISPMERCIEWVKGSTPWDRRPTLPAAFESDINGFPVHLMGHPDGEVAQAACLRGEAEATFARWQAQQRYSRAQNSKQRPIPEYMPGDLVFYWRSQLYGKKAGGTRLQTGRAAGYAGPARILALETRKSEDITAEVPSEADKDEHGEEHSFWAQETAAVALEIPTPTTRHGWKLASRDLETYLASALKKKSVEVYEKNMDPGTKERFAAAKKGGYANAAGSVLEDRPFTSPKARAVVLGYQDPNYEHRITYAPTTTRHTRQLTLQMAACKNWHAWKGDVSAAFLQDRECGYDLYCIPTPELCEGMGIPKESVARLRKACYGLAQAPYEWYETVRAFLLEIGFYQCATDPCCWVLQVEGRVHAIISGHVDDFMMIGDPQDPIWKSTMAAIQDKFKWGEFELNNLTQCGAQIERQEDGLSEVPQSTVEALMSANQLLHKMRDAAKEPMLIHRVGDPEEVALTAWYQWSELLGRKPSLRDPDSMIRRVPGLLVTDSRNVYDRMQQPYISPTGEQKRVDLEVLVLKESQLRTALDIRWVNAQAMLANSLTKRGEDQQFDRFVACKYRWKIVDDPQMFSGRERSKRGLDGLDEPVPSKDVGGQGAMQEAVRIASGRKEEIDKYKA
ncbi:RE2, partial [Symbiodinium pilosum]